CPGLFAWTVHSGDPGKSRQRAIERLRKEVPKLARDEVSRLFVPTGRKLERIRLDLTLDEGGDKKHVAGVFPVVVEPRHTGRETPLRIAYHPTRPSDWFEIAGTTPTPEEVGRAYGRIFGPTDDVDGLKGTSQDKLVKLRLDVDPPSIFALLPSAKEKQEFAGAGRSGEIDALFRVAVNQTARAANGHLHPGLPRKHPRRVMQE